MGSVGVCVGGCEGESMGVCGMVSCRSVWVCGKQWEGERVYRRVRVWVWESVWECGSVGECVGGCGRVCGSVGEVWESVRGSVRGSVW